MGSMKYSLAFVALPAGSSRQRARCIKTGRFVSWAVAPLLRVQVATPSPSPCTVPLLDRVVVVVVVVVVAFLVALVTVSPLPLVVLPLVVLPLVVLPLVALPLVALPLVAVALVVTPSPFPLVAGGGGRDPPVPAPTLSPGGSTAQVTPTPPPGAREGEKMWRPWRWGGVSYGDVGDMDEMSGV